MKVLIATTEDYIKRDRSVLTAGATAGTSAVLTVASAEGIHANDYIVVGTEGSYTAELCQVSAVTETQLTVASLLNNHLSGEPIVKYRYNQRKFYGSTAPSGPWTELTSSGSPVAIDVSNPPGTLLEYTGAEGFTYFAATYYDSASGAQTDINDAIPQLADESLRFCSLYAIRKQCGLTNNANIPDGVIETYRKRAESEIKSFLATKYVMPFVNQSGATEVPDLVENCAVLLAGGFADQQEYGKDGNGAEWIKDARSTLKSLRSPGGQMLIGSDGNEMQTVGNSGSISSFPDMVDNLDGPSQSFSMQDRY